MITSIWPGDFNQVDDLGLVVDQKRDRSRSMSFSGPNPLRINPNNPTSLMKVYIHSYDNPSNLLCFHSHR